MGQRFRTSQMHTAGADPAIVVQGRVIDINLMNWTVNVNATFDRKKYWDVQIGSPYYHYSAGEGLSVMPDIGAQCMICIPGDSAPPFVLCFVMPHETVDPTSTTAPSGTRSHGNTSKSPTDASFANGRPTPKPGDIWLTGRDGNFIKLHRGGVLSIGTTSLAQRMYIPLGNLVTDVSGNYQHFNSGGTQSWTIQEGPAKVHFPTQHLEVYRVFADNKYADIKIAKGNVFSPMPEPDGGTALASTGVGQGSNNEIIYDISIAPGGFDGVTGDIANSGVPKTSVLRFIFDQQGNTLLRIEGQLYLHVTKPVTLDLNDNIAINGEKNFALTTKKGVDIDGGDYTNIQGKAISIGTAQAPAARLADATSSFIQNMPAVVTPIAPIPVLSPAGVPIGIVSPGVPILVLLTVGAPGVPLAIGGSIVATGQSITKV